MGQCDARNTKHSVQTFFNITFCCCTASCWKCSLSFACLTHATKICAITLKFNVRFDSTENGPALDRIFDENIGFFASSKIFDWIIGFCFLGPLSSCTAFAQQNEKLLTQVNRNRIDNRHKLAYHLHSFAFVGIFLDGSMRTNSVVPCQSHNFLCQLQQNTV